jgi:hypothetical protein
MLLKKDKYAHTKYPPLVKGNSSGYFMKMRIIKLRPDFLMKILRGKTNSFASNLPDDTELLDIKYDLFSKQVTAIIRSDEFQDFADSYPIPEFDVVYTPEFNVKLVPNSRKSQPAINSRNQPQHRINPEPEIQPLKELRIQSSQDTSDVEKEFSSEQRKLLSFTVKDEYVIVKPTQFLKTEWNDINDVVTSIGGKWVKGNFDSYWAIPH